MKLLLKIGILLQVGLVPFALGEEEPAELRQLQPIEAPAEMDSFEPEEEEQPPAPAQRPQQVRQAPPSQPMQQTQQSVDAAEIEEIEAEAFGPDATLASPPIAQAPEPDKVPESLPLVDIFSVEENPGAGTLDFQLGANQTKIRFGKQPGFYGFGMVFEGKKLPDQYGQDFSRDVILQLAFGRLRSKLAGQIPQFMASTLIGPKLPGKVPAKFPVFIPRKGQSNAMKSMALVLFSSPETPNDQSDEQKLKGTLFAQSGDLSFKRKGKSKMVDVWNQGQNLKFRLHPMEVQFSLVLGTPFNAQKGSLTGTLLIPVYQPYGGPATKFAQKLAGESMEGTMNLNGGLTRKVRELTGAPK